MNGDIIRRIEECKDIIGHVHTAGNPGRGELDESQEINYPPIMQKLLAIGYQGYVKLLIKLLLILVWQYIMLVLI